MAMPASGCIGIITCPNSVACSSISQAVSGNVTPPKSLCALSMAAGKSAPHNMTEFYGYSAGVSHAVNFTSKTNTGLGTRLRCVEVYITPSPAAGAGEHYCPNITWNFQTSLDNNCCTRIQIFNGSTSAYCCQSNLAGDYLSGNYCADITAGETWCVEVHLERCATGGVEANAAMICLSTITSSTGLYTIGTTCCICSAYTCGAIP